MRYIHHVQVDRHTIQKLKGFVQEHAENIESHGFGYLGKVYLIYSKVGFREALRARGFVCSVVTI